MPIVCGENTRAIAVVVFMSCEAKSGGGFDATTLFKFSNISLLLGVEQDTCTVSTDFKSLHISFVLVSVFKEPSGALEAI